jgi:hypothetical protein
MHFAWYSLYKRQNAINYRVPQICLKYSSKQVIVIVYKLKRSEPIGFLRGLANIELLFKRRTGSLGRN